MKPSERYKIVPKDLYENLMFRRDLLKRCIGNRPLQKAIIDVCRNDVLFFMNAFCWCFEPRPKMMGAQKMPHQIPFIAWEHQTPAILTIKENLGSVDIGVEKSRGEGISWIGVFLALHDWEFEDMASIGFISKEQDAVGDQNNADSLMWKFGYALGKLPKWMAGEPNVDWKRDIVSCAYRNIRNGSAVNGYSSTGNVASGGRKKWILFDELAKFPRPADQAAMASTQHVTDCRLIVSTPLGSSGAYYEAMHAPSGENFVKIIVDWKQNPTRNKGLYEFNHGIPVAVDVVNNPLPSHYFPPNQQVLDLFSRLRRKGYRLDGKIRSPWYDMQCDRVGATPQNIAQELDRDYGGSAYRVFGDSFLTKFEGLTAAHVIEGDFDFDHEKLDRYRFDKIDGGPMNLWIPIDSLGNPPTGMYVLGADICTGSGGTFTSNSTLFGMDMITQEQTLEYACNTINPTDFADFCIVVAKWLGNAFLAWEHNGPGTMFTDRVLKRGYENIFYRKHLSRRGATRGKEAGWWTDERSKEILFGAFQDAVIMNDLIPRSRALLRECGSYIRKEGKIYHALTKNAADDSQGASHGDRVIAAGVCVQAMKDRPIGDISIVTETKALPGTMAARLREYEKSLKQHEDDTEPWIFETIH